MRFLNKRLEMLQVRYHGFLENDVDELKQSRGPGHHSLSDTLSLPLCHHSGNTEKYRNIKQVEI